MRASIQGPITLDQAPERCLRCESGTQPLCNKDGTVWVVLNGEIYNFQNT